MASRSYFSWLALGCGLAAPLLFAITVVPALGSALQHLLQLDSKHSYSLSLGLFWAANLGTLVFSMAAFLRKEPAKYVGVAGVVLLACLWACLLILERMGYAI